MVANLATGTDIQHRSREVPKYMSNFEISLSTCTKMCKEEIFSVMFFRIATFKGFAFS